MTIFCVFWGNSISRIKHCPSAKALCRMTLLLKHRMLQGWESLVIKFFLHSYLSVLFLQMYEENLKLRQENL